MCRSRRRRGRGRTPADEPRATRPDRAIGGQHAVGPDRRPDGRVAYPAEMSEPVYDLLIRGGHLIDPAAGVRGGHDVAFRDGRVAAVSPSIPAERARRVVDARGHVVAPGLVDLHTHVFWGVAHLGIEPDPNCVARGVTTAVDAGCAGATTFPGFRRYVVDVSATRIYALLNISSQGMLDQKVGELEDIRFADV